MRGRLLSSSAVAAVLAAVTVGFVHGQTSSSAGQTPPTTAATAAASRCPLTANQVSTALGTPVKGPDTVCGFESADGKSRPHVLFVRQFGGMCGGSIPAEAGYKEQVPGLGLTTYIAKFPNGTRVLVCRGVTPFEITVDAASADLERRAAIALARQVLSGS